MSEKCCFCYRCLWTDTELVVCGDIQWTAVTQVINMLFWSVRKVEATGPCLHLAGGETHCHTSTLSSAALGSISPRQPA